MGVTQLSLEKEKYQSGTRAALHAIKLRDQPGEALCRVQENTSWFHASLKKMLTAEGNKANRLKRLRLGPNLRFSWVIFLHSCGKMTGWVDVSK